MSDTTELRPSAETEAHRRKVHLDRFHHLCNIKRTVEQLQCPELDKNQLEPLFIYKLEDLDIDEASVCNFGPQYFSPLGEDIESDVYDWDEVMVEPWRRRCHANSEQASLEAEGDPFSTGTWCSRIYEAVSTFEWVHEAFQKAFWKLNDIPWCYAKMEGRDKLLFYQSYHSDHIRNGQFPQFMGQAAFVPTDKSLPHMTCFVTDVDYGTTSTILRSEVLVAITLLKRQLRDMRFVDHHTFPVLLFTFQHDDAVRVTQVHFNGERLFFRTSRQIVLSDEPDMEMFLLMRWIGSRPRGDTLYSAPTCTPEMTGTESAWKQSGGGATPVQG